MNSNLIKKISAYYKSCLGQVDVGNTTIHSDELPNNTYVGETTIGSDSDPMDLDEGELEQLQKVKEYIAKPVQPGTQAQKSSNNANPDAWKHIQWVYTSLSQLENNKNLTRGQKLPRLVTYNKTLAWLNKLNSEGKLSSADASTLDAANKLYHSFVAGD